MVNNNSKGFFPIAWAPDSNVLASGLSNGQIELWDLLLKKKINQVTVEGTHITNLAWSSNGKWLAATTGLDLGNRRFEYMGHRLSTVNLEVPNRDLFCLECGFFSQ